MRVILKPGLYRHNGYTLRVLESHGNKMLIRYLDGFHQLSEDSWTTGIHDQWKLDENDNVKSILERYE